MGSRRAVDAVEKAERRQQILAAGAALVAEQPFARITMAGLARRAGLAKGTTYLYFRSKEELFLHLYLEQVEAWLQELTQATDRLSGNDDPATEIGVWIAHSLAEQPLLLRLVGVLHSVLEQNIDEETAYRFKVRLLRALEPAALSLELAIPAFAGGDGGRFLLRASALVVGMAQAANPPEAVARALDRPELAAMRMEFRADLAQTLNALIRGWRAKSSIEDQEIRDEPR